MKLRLKTLSIAKRYFRLVVPGNSKTLSRAGSVSLMWIFAFFMVALGIAGYYNIHFEMRHLRKSAENDLNSIAMLKVSQIESWNHERYTDVVQFYSTPMIQELAANCITNPAASKQNQQLLHWMEAMQGQDEYSWIALFDAKGEVALSVPVERDSFSSDHDATFREALDTGKIVWLDLHQNSITKDNPNPEIHMSYWVPIIDPNAANSKPIGVCVFQIDPYDFLYPLVQSWPLESKTAETLLVRKEGENVVFLNELRHRKNTALRLKYLLKDYPELPATKAVLHDFGFSEGKDYRGKKVIYSAHRVNETPWYMIAKVDKSELYRPVRNRILMLTIVTLLLVFGIAYLVSSKERKKDAEWLLHQLELEKEKTKLQENFQQIAKQWQTTFDSINDMVWLLDADSNIIRANNSALTELGLSLEHILNHKCWELVHSTSAPPENCPFHVLKQTKQRATEELQWGNKWISVSVDPILDDAGELIGAVHIIRDISEAVEATKVIEDSEVKFRSIFNQSPIGICLVDFDKKFRRANEAFCDFIGYSEEELLSMTFADITHPEHIEQDWEQVNLLVSGDIEFYITEKRYVRKDGEVVWAHVRVTLIKDSAGTPMFLLPTVEDISERMKADQQIKENEERFRSVFEKSVVGMALFYPDGSIQPNASLADMLGYSIEELANNWNLVKHPDDVSTIDKLVASMIKGEAESTRFQIRYIHKDGSIVWADVSTVLHRDRKGKSLYFITTHLDITKQKLYEIEILKMNRVYAVISQINQMVVRSTNKQEILQESCDITVDFGKFKLAWIGEVNTEKHEVVPIAWAGPEIGYLTEIEQVSTLDMPYGRSPAGIVARTGETNYCNDIINSPEMQPWRDCITKHGFRSVVALPIISHEKVILVFVLYSDEPDFFNASELALLEEVSGDIAYALEVLAKDAARTEAERQVQLNEARLQTLIDSAPFGAHSYVLMPDDRLVFVAANLSADRILGIDHSLLIGKEILEAFPGNADTDIPGIYRRVASGGKNYNTVQVSYDDGNISGAFEIHAMNTGVNRMTVFFRDITEKKKADDAIAKLNMELEDRVAARTIDLENANKELEAFSFSVSHDLRSPLRGIAGWSQALAEDYGDILDAQAKQYLDRIVNETIKMNNLIESLLKLSRLSRLAVNPEEVKLTELATEIISRLREEQPEREVTTEVKPGMVVHGDYKLLEIVLTNLFNNAWKFTTKKEQARIEFGEMNKDSESVYYVKDNGAGFDMASASMLFNPFQRLHSNAEFPGTGVGLATVQRIINRHGGRIWVEAEVGKGATFFFTILE